MLCLSMGLPAAAIRRFRIDPGSVSIVDLPRGADGPSVLRCSNYSAHLGADPERPTHDFDDAEM